MKGTRRKALRSREGIVPLVLLCVLAFVLLFYRLGAMALIGPDEPRYAEVAREMLDRGDFITPTLGGKPWLEKPVLLYWLMAASFSVFGVTEGAARLPSALSALLLVIILYVTGWRLASPRFGFVSALVGLVNPLMFSFARGATTDMLLCATLSSGLALFFLATRETQKTHRTWLTRAAVACFGLACLAKGLVGVVIPGLVLGLYLMIHRPARPLTCRDLLDGAIVMLLVTSIWYVPMIVRHGWTFIEEFFVSHHIERFLSNKFRHPGPAYYYLPIVLAGSFPWTPLLIRALARLRRGDFIRQRPAPAGRERLGRYPDEAEHDASTIRSHAEDREQTLAQLRTYAFLWLTIPVIFFSFSGSKLPGYILPVMPAAAFLIAGELEALISQKRHDRWTRVAIFSLAVLIPLVLVALLFYSRKVFGLTLADIAPVVVSGAITAIVIFVLALMKRFRAFLVALVIGVVTAAVATLHLFQPLVQERESLHPLALIAQEQLQPGERIIGYFTWHHSLTFYTRGRSLYDARGNVIIAQSPETLHRYISIYKTRLVLTSRRAWADLRKDERFGCLQLAAYQDKLLLRCDVKPAYR